MRLYQITELEKLTGIKAHTIRIWEKRYNLIEPDRTSTNYRRYNDEQVKKLLNVSTLLSNGYKISKIAAFNEKEFYLKIIESKETKNEDVVCTTFINELLSAMIDFDERTFQKTYLAVIKHLGLFEAMLNVFYPLLNKIGLLWTINDINPAQEHFASCLIKRKIMSETDALPFAKSRKKKFLLLLVPGEMHDISLLFANYIIRSKGHETIYLGQDVPYENISVVLKQIKPNFILTFFTLPQNPKDVYSDFKKNIHLGENTKLIISGQSNITEHLKNKIDATVVYHPKDLLSYL
ncbi:MAG: MerR family transcriptional regulator [Burkholderiales bacterium]|nr:MerR family transcriptional regulator [Bacteroidia bacterium]